MTQNKNKKIVTDAELANDLRQAWSLTGTILIASEIFWVLWLIRIAQPYWYAELFLVSILILNVVGFAAGPRLNRIKYQRYILARAQVKAIMAMNSQPNLDFVGPSAATIDETSYMLGYCNATATVALLLKKVEDLQKAGD
jgi:hypothetical protein